MQQNQLICKKMQTHLFSFISCLCLYLSNGAGFLFVKHNYVFTISQKKTLDSREILVKDNAQVEWKIVKWTQHGTRDMAVRFLFCFLILLCLYLKEKNQAGKKIKLENFKRNEKPNRFLHQRALFRDHSISTKTRCRFSANIVESHAT